MKYRVSSWSLFFLFVILALGWPGRAIAQTATATPTATPTPLANLYSGITVNSQGLLGAPIAVGTATPVMILSEQHERTRWCRYAESAPLRCAPVPIGASTPVPIPSQTVGEYFPFGLRDCQPQEQISITTWRHISTQQGIWCVAIGSSGTNVDTSEESQ
jgi:hypothetical protein